MELVGGKANVVWLNKDHVIADCVRCGTRWQFNHRYLFGRNYDSDLCPGCKAKPAKQLRTGFGVCVPWQGEVDLDTMQPLKDGLPVFVYERVCGNADCVAKGHRK